MEHGGTGRDDRCVCADRSMIVRAIVQIVQSVLLPVAGEGG
jgi:hypothetical protein